MAPPPAVSAIRTGVRRLLDLPEVAPYLGEPLVVACSGGADSLALAAAATHVAHRRGLRVTGIVIDHGLQRDSAAVAGRTTQQLAELDCDEVRTVKVAVGDSGGMEAAARRARYDALEQHRAGSLVLLGHTRNDQAETVLLGLGRGSGPRSISGMRTFDPPWARPLLDTTRETTAQACAELGIQPWQDPHNTDARFTRVRLRHEVLPLLEDVLQGGVGDALARTAMQVREDSEALDALAEDLRAQAATDSGLDAHCLAKAPAALRRRVLRRWLLDRGVPELSDSHLRAADALIDHWRGQGGHALPGNFELRRARGTLLVECG